MTTRRHLASVLTRLALVPAVLSPVGGCMAPPPGEALEGLVDDTRSASDLLGLSMVVSQGGDRWSAASGRCSLDGDPMTATTPLVIGSLTKLFSATLVMQLVEEGVLALDDTIEPWFPEQPRAEEITIEDLLSHKSGAPDYRQSSAVRSDGGRHWEPHELLAAANTLEADPSFEPGVDSEYSNTNYLMLGIIVEDVTGRTWEDLLRERITEPLGLQDTFVAKAWGEEAPLELGYKRTISGYSDVYGLVDPSVGWFVGSMVSTSEDLDRFAEALFHGELVSTETLDEMTIVRGSDSDGEIDIGMGLGVMIVATPGGTLYGHTGGIDGYTAFLAYDPDTDTVVAANANTEGAGLEGPALKVFDYMAAR
jgi:D-alanyl-D-alanine carboxypeptidase